MKISFSTAIVLLSITMKCLHFSKYNNHVKHTNTLYTLYTCTLFSGKNHELWLDCTNVQKNDRVTTSGGDNT